MKIRVLEKRRIAIKGIPPWHFATSTPTGCEGYLEGDIDKIRAADMRMNRKGFLKPKQKLVGDYKVKGFKAQEDVPVADYMDFVGAEFHQEEVKHMLHFGAFPPGMELEQRGILLKVVGDYGRREMLVEVK